MKLNSPTKLRRQVGRRIGALREARGWTQEELAEKVGVSARYLQSIEAGTENLTLDSLAKIGNALRVEARELLRPTPRKPAARR